MPFPPLESKALPSPSQLVEKECFWPGTLNEQGPYWLIAALTDASQFSVVGASLSHDFHRNNHEVTRDRPAHTLDIKLGGQH